jgi:hypothetical protein
MTRWKTEKGNKPDLLPQIAETRLPWKHKNSDTICKRTHSVTCERKTRVKGRGSYSLGF